MMFMVSFIFLSISMVNAEDTATITSNRLGVWNNVPVSKLMMNGELQIYQANPNKLQEYNGKPLPVYDSKNPPVSTSDILAANQANYVTVKIGKNEYTGYIYSSLLLSEGLKQYTQQTATQQAGSKPVVYTANKPTLPATGFKPSQYNRLVLVNGVQYQLPILTFNRYKRNTDPNKFQTNNYVEVTVIGENTHIYIPRQVIDKLKPVTQTSQTTTSTSDSQTCPTNVEVNNRGEVIVKTTADKSVSTTTTTDTTCTTTITDALCASQQQPQNNGAVDEGVEFDASSARASLTTDAFQNQDEFSSQTSDILDALDYAAINALTADEADNLLANVEELYDNIAAKDSNDERLRALDDDLKQKLEDYLDALNNPAEHGVNAQFAKAVQLNCGNEKNNAQNLFGLLGNPQTQTQKMSCTETLTYPSVACYQQACGGGSTSCGQVCIPNKLTAVISSGCDTNSEDYTEFALEDGGTGYIKTECLASTTLSSDVYGVDVDTSTTDSTQQLASLNPVSGNAVASAGSSANGKCKLVVVNGKSQSQCSTTQNDIIFALQNALKNNPSVDQYSNNAGLKILTGISLEELKKYFDSITGTSEDEKRAKCILALEIGSRYQEQAEQMSKNLPEVSTCMMRIKTTPTDDIQYRMIMKNGKRYIDAWRPAWGANLEGNNKFGDWISLSTYTVPSDYGNANAGMQVKGDNLDIIIGLSDNNGDLDALIKKNPRLGRLVNDKTISSEDCTKTLGAKLVRKTAGVNYETTDLALIFKTKIVNGEEIVTEWKTYTADAQPGMDWKKLSETTSEDLKKLTDVENKQYSRGYPNTNNAILLVELLSNGGSIRAIETESENSKRELNGNFIKDSQDYKNVVDTYRKARDSLKYVIDNCPDFSLSAKLALADLYSRASGWRIDESGSTNYQVAEMAYKSALPETSDWNSINLREYLFGNALHQRKIGEALRQLTEQYKLAKQWQSNKGPELKKIQDKIDKLELDKLSIIITYAANPNGLNPPDPLVKINEELQSLKKEAVKLASEIELANAIVGYTEGGQDTPESVNNIIAILSEKADKGDETAQTWLDRLKQTKSIKGQGSGLQDYLKKLTKDCGTLVNREDIKNRLDELQKNRQDVISHSDNPNSPNTISLVKMIDKEILVLNDNLKVFDDNEYKAKKAFCDKLAKANNDAANALGIKAKVQLMVLGSMSRCLLSYNLLEAIEKRSYFDGNNGGAKNNAYNVILNSMNVILTAYGGGHVKLTDKMGNTYTEVAIKKDLVDMMSYFSKENQLEDFIKANVEQRILMILQKSGDGDCMMSDADIAAADKYAAENSKKEDTYAYMFFSGLAKVKGWGSTDKAQHCYEQFVRARAIASDPTELLLEPNMVLLATNANIGEAIKFYQDRGISINDPRYLAISGEKPDDSGFWTRFFLYYFGSNEKKATPKKLGGEFDLADCGVDASYAEMKWYDGLVHNFNLLNAFLIALPGSQLRASAWGYGLTPSASAAIAAGQIGGPTISQLIVGSTAAESIIGAQRTVAGVLSRSFVLTKIPIVSRTLCFTGRFATDVAIGMTTGLAAGKIAKSLGLPDWAVEDVSGAVGSLGIGFVGGTGFLNFLNFNNIKLINLLNLKMANGVIIADPQTGIMMAGIRMSQRNLNLLKNNVAGVRAEGWELVELPGGQYALLNPSRQKAIQIIIGNEYAAGGRQWLIIENQDQLASYQASRFLNKVDKPQLTDARTSVTGVRDAAREAVSNPSGATCPGGTGQASLNIQGLDNIQMPSAGGSCPAGTTSQSGCAMTAEEAGKIAKAQEIYAARGIVLTPVEIAALLSAHRATMALWQNMPPGLRAAQQWNVMNLYTVIRSQHPELEARTTNPNINPNQNPIRLLIKELGDPNANVFGPGDTPLTSAQIDQVVAQMQERYGNAAITREDAADGTVTITNTATGEVTRFQKTDGTCLPAGTKITMADNSKKNIEDIQIGEKVKSYDTATGKVVDGNVYATEKRTSNGMCRIVFEDGSELKLTENHAVYTTDGWKSISPEETAKTGLSVEQLEVGDSVLSE